MHKKIIQTVEAPAPIGPYNQAVLVNNTLYASGQIAIDAATGQLVTENITAETHLVMKNLKAILTAAGMGFQNVVKCTIFIKNMDDFAAINEVYGQYFTEMPPARETVEVARLPKNVNVEISCIAVV
jgi:2-iminobutanoate/2-iminopropanoate deaminase